MSNPFNVFKTQTKKVKIKALDNAEIEIRELTVLESNELFKELFNEKGVFDSSKSITVRLKKVSMAMVKPAMSVADLEALGAKANVAIAEISEAIDATEQPEGLDEKGN